jgi:hypothetical protein
MIRPSSFAIHVTYTCPLACAHCCFHSQPGNKDRLDLEVILETIAALDPSEIRLIAFTGGEPFLLGTGLVKAVKAASSRGFKTRVVTSAYFGAQRSHAKKRLTALVQAGLAELSISWDDYHEEFVSFDCVANVFHEAASLGLQAAVSIVQDGTTNWTAELVRARLGLPPNSPEVICESSLNRTGRAEQKLNERPLRSTRTLGPCPYVLTGPTLSATGKLLACCGVIPNTKELVIDDAYRPQNLTSAIERSLRSPLLNWLFLRGPYSIIEYIGDNFSVPIPLKENIGGNCEACKLLFETPEIANHLDSAVEMKALEIEAETAVLSALGLSGPKEIMNLWADQAIIADQSPVEAL